MTMFRDVPSMVGIVNMKSLVYLGQVILVPAIISILQFKWNIVSSYVDVFTGNHSFIYKDLLLIMNAADICVLGIENILFCQRYSVQDGINVSVKVLLQLG